MSLNYRIETEKDHTSIVLEGPIDGDSGTQLSNLHSESVGSLVRIDFSRIEYVNSLGIRCWINFLRGFQEGRTLIFEKCPAEIVTQINMVPKFLGGAKVESFFGNFGCTSCSHEHRHLFNSDRGYKGLVESLDEITCEQCGEFMELEEEEESYFQFLKDD